MSTAAEAAKFAESPERRPVDWLTIKEGEELTITASHYITIVEGMSGRQYYTLRKDEAPGVHDKSRRASIEGVYVGEIPFIPDGDEIGDPDLINLARSQMCRLIEKARDQDTRLPFIIPPDAKAYHIEPLPATS